VKCWHREAIVAQEVDDRDLRTSLHVSIREDERKVVSEEDGTTSYGDADHIDIRTYFL
jgi:hypothetical protein